MIAPRKPTTLQILWAERPDRRALLRNGFIALTLLLLGAVVVLRAHYFGRPSPQVQSYGFGPGWDCTETGYGEPICIKRAQPASQPEPAGVR